VLGDFNSWHPYWGSPKSNKRGRTLANYIDRSNYILLNDKSPTHFSTYNTYRHIDLSFASASIAPEISWEVLDDLHGSDHFPILISILRNQTVPTFIAKPSFKLKDADWNLFKEKITSFSSESFHSLNVNQEAATIKKILIRSAHISIPQNSTFTQPRTVPWWNSNKKMEETQ